MQRSFRKVLAVLRLTENHGDFSKAADVAGEAAPKLFRSSTNDQHPGGISAAKDSSFEKSRATEVCAYLHDELIFSAILSSELQLTYELCKSENPIGSSLLHMSRQ